MANNVAGSGPGTPSWTSPDAASQRPPTEPAVRRPPRPAGMPPGGPWYAHHPADPGAQMRVPSGLFPTGPPRPVYREPFPVRGGVVALALVSGALWMILFGSLATTAGAFGWSMIVAGVLAWLVALLLARMGDRGVAVGVAISTAIGISIGTIVVISRWVDGDWPLW